MLADLRDTFFNLENLYYSIKQLYIFYQRLQQNKQNLLQKYFS